ncbi:MAG: adenylosuccinate lyase [Candidatus Altiarchaeales archaeon ex4484_96]|nr:MAG: adenylosuccinate lyase [Candidatus Altiarchaeales archaeon ex4484_96]
MAIHPIESRYGRKKVKEIFDEESKLARMLKVEAALVKAHAKVGNIPPEDAALVARKANTRTVSLARVKQIEKEINHDVMAICQALAEQCGSQGGYVHMGATSNDIQDTALALQLRDYVFYLEEDLMGLKKELLKQAGRHVDTITIGRTHGQHATPTTYGLKFAIYATEVQRHLDRLGETKKRILVGQLTGAVGTQAALGEKAQLIQKHMMNELELEPVRVSNQVIQRDRHAEFLLLLALISETLNKIATEIRNLQRTEIGEVREGFGKKQVGSSTMPHKMNPILAERISGLSRVIKADAFASLDNIALWHERDLTNSSCERIIIPEACILTDYILSLSIDLIKNLVFDHKAIEKNLNLSHGRIMAESVMVALVSKGVSRDNAHKLTRECALQSYKKDMDFKKTLLENKEIKEKLSEKELDKSLDPSQYIGTAVKQVNRVLKELK